MYIMYICMCVCLNAYVVYYQGMLGASKAKEQASSEAIEKLNEAWIGLEKACKASMKILSRGEENLDGASGKFKASLQELNSTMEAADSIVADVGFLLKYKKTRAQQELSVPLAMKVLTMAATCLQNLLDGTKSMRALLPKAE